MKLLPKQLRGEERVPVFDPEVGNLSLVALSQLDSSFIPLQRDRFAEALKRILTCLAAQYIVLEIPRLRPRFDIYGSDEPEAEKSYAVVTSLRHVNVEMRYIARLDFYRFGWWRAGTMRMIGAKYRRLWVGPIPASALREYWIP